MQCVPQVASEGFRARNELDLALHSVASAELDRRWAANRAELDGQLAQFKALREKAERLCEGGGHLRRQRRRGPTGRRHDEKSTVANDVTDQTCNDTYVVQESLQDT